MGTGLGNGKKTQQLLVWLQWKAKGETESPYGASNETKLGLRGNLVPEKRTVAGAGQGEQGRAPLCWLLSLDLVGNRIQQRGDVRTPAAAFHSHSLQQKLCFFWTPEKPGWRVVALVPYSPVCPHKEYTSTWEISVCLYSSSTKRRG